MAKKCALYTVNLLGEACPGRVDRITDRPDMTSAVYHGLKASTQPHSSEPYSLKNSDTIIFKEYFKGYWYKALKFSKY